MVLQSSSIGDSPWDAVAHGQQHIGSDASCAFQLSPLDDPRVEGVRPLSPGVGNSQTDAQVLAQMLQEQLDVINNEIRYC